MVSLMESLNFHHLRYFYVVAREGSVAAASRLLGVGRPAISAQIKSLEASLGTRLLRRAGRGLVLTAAGETAYAHAGELFERGHALVEAVRRGSGGPATVLRVGVADVLAKLVAYRLLAPGVGPEHVERLQCLEDHPEALFAELALRHLDVVLCDRPLPQGLGVRGASHRLGDTAVVLMGARDMASDYVDDFPASIEHAPMLMPGPGSALRRTFEHWLEVRGLRPRVRAEFEDSALMKAFGQAGWGLFPLPAIIAPDVVAKGEVVVLGELEGLREEYFAVTPQSQSAHPALEALVAGAQQALASD